MSDEETRSPDDLPLEPILLPEDAVAPPWGPVVSPAILVDPPRRPRVWTVFVLYLLLIVGQLVLGLVLVPVFAFLLHGPTFDSAADFGKAIQATIQSHAWFLGCILGTGVLLAGATTVAALLSPVPLRDRLCLKPARLSLVALLVSVVGTLAVSETFSGLDGLGWLPDSWVLEDVAIAVGDMSGPTLLAAVLLIGLGPGIGEELLFRGYIQTRLRRRWGPGWAILVTSILFGVMHVDPVQGSFATAVGLFLGYLTERTGSIWPAVVCHTVNNMISTLQAGLGGPEIEGPLANSLAVVGSILVVALSVGYLHRYVKPAPTKPPEAG